MTTRSSDGNYLRRGGKMIAVEKVEDRFTVLTDTQADVDRIGTLRGVRAVQPVTKGVVKVETSTADRDTAMASVRSAAIDAVAHHAYKPKDSEGTVFYLTDKIIVRFRSEATPEQIDALLEKYKLVVIRAYEGEKNTYLLQVTRSSGENPLKISNHLADEPLVESSEPNLINRFMRAFMPPDTLFSRQWHLHAEAGPQLDPKASISAPDAWDITRGDRSIVVAVVDDGFDLGHPDFSGDGKVVAPHDYVDGDGNPFPVGNDYHGTPCAGVAIAESNGTGVVGAAHGCAFMPVRFPLSADDDLLISVFNEVARHAHVISCSWGPPPVHAGISDQISRTFARLAREGGPHRRGCVILFAAGNFNAPLNDPSNTSGFVWRDYNGVHRTTSGPILNGYACHPDVVCVAASTSLNRHSAYSNWGAEVGVCAPSDNFHPLDPQAFVAGRGIWTTDNEAHGAGFTTNSRFTGVFGGTSSATPLAAGVAALVLSANPNLGALEVKSLLQQTADKIVDNQPDVVLGTTRGAYDASGRCDWFGFGKVNAAAAVMKARGELTPSAAIPSRRQRKKKASENA